MFTASRLLGLGLAAFVALSFVTPGIGQDKKSEPKKSQKSKEVWTDPNDSTLPVDFKIQGEYAGDKIGVQIIALGKGELQAVVLAGGLPGAGWDGKNKSLMQGKVEGEGAVFELATGKRNYLAGPPAQFSATRKFPPVGQKEYSGKVAGDVLTLKTEAGEVKLQKTVRKSPTMGAEAPGAAMVLFDGKSVDAFKGGRLDKNTGLLNTDGGDVRTKEKFLNYSVHLEFMLPYRPDARGQGRGNSGFYQVDQYEVQILDSFGLDGVNNECGGVYTKLDPKVNMCLPPLQWQTYDIDFTAAVVENGKKVKNARITAKHNGVVIHDDAEIKGTTGGARMEPEGTPGSLQLQGHGNPLQFRNFWVVIKK